MLASLVLGILFPHLRFILNGLRSSAGAVTQDSDGRGSDKDDILLDKHSTACSHTIKSTFKEAKNSLAAVEPVAHTASD